ncbi:MAG: HAMP domain-containing histidine kinase [Acidimicrobiia bacterium]|nr:HAMP domain-containing histidine kinase [Acidimicrobiia bacterium]
MTGPLDPTRLDALATAVLSTPPADDPLVPAAHAFCAHLGADVALLALEGRGALVVADVIAGPKALLGRTWPVQNFDAVAWQLDASVAATAGVGEAFLLRVGGHSRVERAVLVLGWTDTAPDTVTLRLASRIVAAEREAHQARRLTRFGRQAAAWSSRLAAGVACRAELVAEDFLETLLALVPYSSGAVWVSDAGGGRRRVAVLGGGPHGHMDDTPLVELAISSGRAQWFDASQEVVDQAVVAAPFMTQGGSAAIVVRSLDPGCRVFPHDVDVVTAAARELSVVLDLVDAVGRARASAGPTDLLLAMAEVPPETDADLLACLADRITPRGDADMVFVVTGRHDAGRGVYTTVDGISGEWETSGHNLVAETEEGSVVVSRVSGLRAAEEEVLSALDVRSYLAARIGDGTVLGIGSSTEDAFDAAAAESFRATAAVAGALRAAGRARGRAETAESRVAQFGRASRRLMTAIGHQFRTPLTSIAGFTRTLINPDLADTVAEGESRDFLEIIARQAGRLGRIVENFQLASELQLGSWRSVESDVDVDELVRSVTDELTSISALEEPIVLEASGGRIRTDPEALKAMVANLVDNAIRFGRPPVEVSVGRRTGGLRLRVVDHGPGLGAGEREELVRPWVAADADESNPSVGLGLALVADLAERLGGRMEMRDTPGGGLTVEITLASREGAREA